MAEDQGLGEQVLDRGLPLEDGWLLIAAHALKDMHGHPAAAEASPRSACSTPCSRLSAERRRKDLASRVIQGRACLQANRCRAGGLAAVGGKSRTGAFSVRRAEQDRGLWPQPHQMSPADRRAICSRAVSSPIPALTKAPCPHQGPKRPVLAPPGLHPLLTAAAPGPAAECGPGAGICGRSRGRPWPWRPGRPRTPSRARRPSSAARGASALGTRQPAGPGPRGHQPRRTRRGRCA